MCRHNLKHLSPKNSTLFTITSHQRVKQSLCSNLTVPRDWVGCHFCWSLWNSSHLALKLCMHVRMLQTLQQEIAIIRHMRLTWWQKWKQLMQQRWLLLNHWGDRDSSCWGILRLSKLVKHQRLPQRLKWHMGLRTREAEAIPTEFAVKLRPQKKPTVLQTTSVPQTCDLV